MFTHTKNIWEYMAPIIITIFFAHHFLPDIVGDIESEHVGKPLIRREVRIAALADKTVEGRSGKAPNAVSQSLQ